MRANSHLVLVDLHTSWHSSQQISNSTFAYLQSCKSAAASISAAFRRSCGRRGKISSSRTPEVEARTAEIRRPREWPTRGNGLLSVSSKKVSTSSSFYREDEVVSDMDLFLDTVPLRMRQELLRHDEIRELIEVVMDLGRKPIARFPSGDWIISEETVKLEDLRHAISKVGEFSDDNRSGIDRSLHRISAIRNRKTQIIGLTCRVGRAISGSAEIIHDLVEDGGSILVIGPPGVGKTTLIREIARMLADDHKKRVIIVDTSNEIGGDGDVPHSGIGRARRMQVPNVHLQHNVMIEAVENHMPETIIIDEIGTELEALAASTIAQRGVQLVATAHGITIESIIKNPSLQILVGGIESVTLGDEEARKRKVQKTILERKGPSTFTCAVEMISKTECRVHHRLDATVDAILAGKYPLFEVRRIEDEAKDHAGDAEANSSSKLTQVTEQNRIGDTIDKKSLKSTQHTGNDNVRDAETYVSLRSNRTEQTHFGDFNMADVEIEESKIKGHKEVDDYHPKSKKIRSNVTMSRKSPVYVYTYKIQDADLLQVAAVMGFDDKIDVTDDIGFADAILASSYEVKQNPWIQGVAKSHQMPVFVIKSSTMAQMVKAIRMILGMDLFTTTQKQSNRTSLAIEIEDDAPKIQPSLEEIDALEEVRLAIEYIVIPGGEPVELLPRRSDIVARQLELVESYQLAAENSGTELNPRLQILPQKLNKGNFKPSSSFFFKYDGSVACGEGGTSVFKLPFLPE
ncbi:protein SEEDLING PLASTID DEVELOPMENT 1 [Primulina eburnea]|uniref:protein SEEDLING PLASTID DEVELOPMENT 1 n=1 Tax=Primulina eburnea TaxID=1245227 RepID=UPI003C6C2851